MANVNITYVQGNFTANLSKFSFNANLEVIKSRAFLPRKRENFEPRFFSVSNHQLPK